MTGASRIDRATAILRLDAEATAEAIAEVLWLASRLPEASQPQTDAQTDAGSGGTQGKAAKEDDSGKKPKTAEPPPVVVPGPNPSLGLYPKQRSSAEDPSIPATFITVPAAEALPHRLLMERALKPFLKKFPSRRLQELDGAATAEKSADRRHITPVFRPTPERWFEVVLLVERTDAMEVWTDTIRELQVLLGRHGAFRKVRVLRYAVHNHAVILYTAARQPLPANAIADPEGRRLLLFITDGTSVEWRRRTLVNFVQTLGQRTVVAILQVLPPRLWSRTALGDALERVSAVVPAAPNSGLQHEDPLTGMERRVTNASYVPVLTFDPAHVGRWAQFVIAPRRVLNPAIYLEAEPEPEPQRPGDDAAPAPDGKKRVAAFRAAASEGAIQLLRVLAGVPLTLPVMRLVHQTVGPARELSHLAEVMLSGLIERVTPADSNAPADEVFYEFIPGVREQLIGTLASHELDALDDAMQPAQEKLRAFVEKQTGAVRDFRALLAHPEGLERLPASARAFVEVSRRIYEARGILPPQKDSQPNSDAAALEIPQRLLDSGRYESVVITGSGGLVFAARGSAISIWEHGAKRFTWGSVTRAGGFQLLRAIASDEVFAINQGTVQRILPDEGLVDRLKLEPNVEAVALTPSGEWLVTAQEGHLYFRPLSKNRRAFQIPGPDTGRARALAVGAKIAAVGVEDNSVYILTSPNEYDLSAQPTSVQLIVPGEIASIVTSMQGESTLILTREGLSYLYRAGETTTLIRSEFTNAVSLTTTADGVFAAHGHRDGLVSIWDLSRLVRVLELRHGEGPVHSISISGTGDHLIAASDAGLRLWDLSGFMRQARLMVQRKARVNRTILLIVATDRGDLGKQIRDALNAAGHRVVQSTNDYDYVVTVGTLRNPYYPEVLLIDSLERLPWLLEEIDRDPPGRVTGLPRELQRAIARPTLEESLARFLQGHPPGTKLYIRSEPFAGVTTTLRNVLMRDDVRRAYSGGIYWKATRIQASRRGPILVAVENEKIPTSISYAGLAVMSHNKDEAVFAIMSPAGDEPSNDQPSDGPAFAFPPLTNEEAAAHLQAAGMSADEAEHAAAFHRGFPILVSLAAGAAKRGSVPVRTGPNEPLDNAFESVARIAIESLDEAARTELLRFAARLEGTDAPPADTALQFARDFGWVMAAGQDFRIINMARQVIEKHWADEFARAHEYHCVWYEAGKADLTGAGIIHAGRAGGAARIEKFLRNRRALRNYSSANPAGLLQTLLPYAKDNPFLTRICEVGAQALRVQPRIVDLLLAPTPQWPPESGIPGGHAQGFKGAGIRIAVPGTGCNPEHPEFAGRSMPAGTLDVATYGTGVCSVIGGSYIGIAPESIIEPITVMTSQLQTTDSELAITLTRLLTNPPDIVCLTLAFDGLHPESPLRQAIAELVKHDVLVVAAAGNDGEGGLTTPGVLPEVLSVGYCDFSGAAADNSSHGWWTEVSPARAVPDVFGYGVDVNHASDNDGYEAGSGSTYGAAYVAGVAALYAQALGLRGEPLKELLIRTADPQTKVIRFAIETDRASAA